MKIHMGCGARYWDGYINIDIQPPEGGKVDIQADLRKIPLDDGVADEIQAIHVFEHFYYWEAEEVLQEWRRLLKPGGYLIMELPDMLKCCQNFVQQAKGFHVGKQGKNPDQLTYWGLYGDPRPKNPFMCHRWGWTPQTLSAFLTERGFKVTNANLPTIFHSVGRGVRDMRVEAVRL
jgi:SAM-dependent methyltransferase